MRNYSRDIFRLLSRLAFLVFTASVTQAQSTPLKFGAILSLEKGDKPGHNIAGDVLYEGDLITGSIVFDVRNWDGKTKYYCYVIQYTENYDHVMVAFPQEGVANAEFHFPQLSGEKVLEKVILFEGVISAPFGKDNFVLVMTEKPIDNIHALLSNNNETRYKNDVKLELLKLVKGSRLSDLYKPEYGNIQVRTLQIESRPADERSGLTKAKSGKRQLFAIEDSSEIFYTPLPVLDIVRDSFPAIELLDPSFDSDRTKGLKKIQGDRKILMRGIAVDWKRGLEKITVNGIPVNTYRENTGYFDHLFEPKAGKNDVEIAAENKRGYKHTMRFQFDYQPEKNKVVSGGKDYLLVIGINDYNAWPRLKNASKDADDFRKLMIANYGFSEENTTALMDGEATRKKIYSRLRSFVEDLQENDRLLVYFSGHGYYDQTLDMGYWIPVDATEGADDEYLGNLDITRMIQKMKAKQIFLIADACYSGQLLRDMQKSQDGNYKSRLVLCSGKLQTVLDGKPGTNSPFSSRVLEFLRNEKADAVRATDLIRYVKKSFENSPGQQQAVGGAIDEVGDENGDFTFEKKK